MDPLTSSASVAALVTISSQAILHCHDIFSKRQDAPRILSALQSECSMTCESLVAICKLISRSDVIASLHLPTNESLAQTFDIALTGCTVALSALDNELQKIMNGRELEAGLGLHQRAKYAWNEDILARLASELRAQRGALGLLVSIVQWFVCDRPWTIPFGS
jgi:hypothetical protein